MWGLEYALLFWGNRAPCVLPFGSVEEAKWRFCHFVADAARWEQAATPTPTPLADGVEQAEVGRFRLTRRATRIHLDVAVDGRKYRRLLEVSADHASWDWGEGHNVV